MLRFQPSFSFWPPPEFLGDSRHGLAAWIIDREALLDPMNDSNRAAAIRRIIDSHHDENGQTIEPPRPADV